MEYYLFLSYFFPLLLFCYSKNATKTVNQTSETAAKSEKENSGTLWIWIVRLVVRQWKDISEMEDAGFRD